MKPRWDGEPTCYAGSWCAVVMVREKLGEAGYRGRDKTRTEAMTKALDFAERYGHDVRHLRPQPGLW